MAVKADLEPQAKILRAQGKSYQDIAEALGVNEKTIRRWAQSWEPLGEVIEGQVIGMPQSSASAGWPEERKWPRWTVDDLTDLPDFRPDDWEDNLARIRTAESLDNLYVPWFYRRLVELARRSPMPDGSVNWSLAIAALPVLADWLDCLACDDLAALIEEHRPWDGAFFGRARRLGTYQRAARPVAAAVRQCVLSTQATMVQVDLAHQKVTPGPVLLAAFAERLPIFDRPPRRLHYRRYNLGSIILGILSTPKGG